jgi:hypothetical protein
MRAYSAEEAGILSALINMAIHSGLIQMQAYEYPIVDLPNQETRFVLKVRIFGVYTPLLWIDSIPEP